MRFTEHRFNCVFANLQLNNCKQNISAIPPPFTQTVALLIFVMSDQFCQAVRPILPGSPPDFEMGIFLSLCLILCNSCPIVSQTFQMKLSINLWTKKQRKIFSPYIYREFHLKSLTHAWTWIAQKSDEEIGKFLSQKSVGEPGKIRQTAKIRLILAFHVNEG